MRKVELTIHIADIFAKAQQFSSFEGRNAVTPNGESDYPEVHITDQDKALIYTYADEGLHILADLLTDVIWKTSYTYENVDKSEFTDNDSATFGFYINVASIDDATLDRQIIEVLASYVMRLWVSDHKPSRVDFYISQYQDLLSALTDILYRQDAPVKHRRKRHQEICEVEVIAE